MGTVRDQQDQHTRQARKPAAPCRFSSSKPAWIALVAAAVLLTHTAFASAALHMWVIDEVYSNAAGNVQYVQMLQTPPQDFEHFFADAILRSDGQSFTFPSNLPSFTTADRNVLIATDAFAALPGAVAPDFTIPENFFATDADTIVFEDPFGFGVINTFSFGPGDLPLDGVHALDRDGNVVLNAPTNFDGEVGFLIPEPTTGALLLLTALAQLRRRPGSRRGA